MPCPRLWTSSVRELTASHQHNNSMPFSNPMPLSNRHPTLKSGSSLLFQPIVLCLSTEITILLTRSRILETDIRFRGEYQLRVSGINPVNFLGLSPFLQSFFSLDSR